MGKIIIKMSDLDFKTLAIVSAIAIGGIIAMTQMGGAAEPAKEAVKEKA